MKNSLFALAALMLLGCVMDNNDTGPKLIGYSYGRTGAIGEATPGSGYTGWEMRRDTVGLDTFFVYGTVEDQNQKKLGDRTRAAIQGSKHIPIYDMGGSCLSFIQTGKDTTMLNGQKVIVDVPIEPCFPYSLVIVVK